MSKGRFKINGKVINKDSQRPVRNIRVCAWDKDKYSSDQLGVSFTDRKGVFSISYDKAAFKDDPSDDSPDIFFLIYQDETLIHSTEGSPLKHHQTQEEVLIEIELANDDTEDQPDEPIYYASGKLVNAITDKVLAGFKVEAWDKDKKVSDQLGTSPSDYEGNCSIRFDDNRFTRVNPKTTREYINTME